MSSSPVQPHDFTAWKQIRDESLHCLLVEKPSLFKFCDGPIRRSSVSDGRTDLYNSLACSQWPCLYMSYEATYALKCLVFEIIVKNRISSSRVHKNGFFRFSQKLSILAYMLLQSSYINVAITNILVYSKSLYDLPEPK